MVMVAERLIVMKLAYAACQASKHDVSFSQKTTMLFRPDQSSIGRLVNRKKNGKNTAKVSVGSDTAKIGMTFSTKTKKWGCGDYNRGKMGKANV